jgi:aspartate kinase
MAPSTGVHSDNRSDAGVAPPLAAGLGWSEPPRYRVLKFGGTSVARPDALRAAVRRVAEALDEAVGGRVVVVVSAVAGVTDRLVQLVHGRLEGSFDRSELAALEVLHRDLLLAIAPGEQVGAGAAIDRQLALLERQLEQLPSAASPRVARDLALATGERLSAPLFRAALAANGIQAAAVDAAELLLTDGNFGDAEVDLDASAERARRRLEAVENPASRVIVVPGFFGSSTRGAVTLLGRGGSDTAATALAAALGADRVDICTDVDGVFSADPRRVPAAQRLPRVRRDEAADLAFFGAKVLHHKCLAPLEYAARRGRPIELCVVATGESAGGTWIDDPAATAAAGTDVEGARVRAVAVQTRLAAVSLPVRGERRIEILRALRRLQAPIYRLTSLPAGDGIEVLLSEESARGACAALLESARATIRGGLAVVAAVGSSIAWAGGEVVGEFRRAVGSGAAPGSSVEFGDAFPNVLLAVIEERHATEVARAVHSRLIERGAAR